MAIFHFCYDLSLFGLLPFDSESGFFPIFRYFIVTLFFTAVGFGLYAANTPTIQWRSFWLREAKVIAGAAVITLTTLFMYPSSWVWFGVLHFIALASLLSLPLIRFPRTALSLGMAMFILYNLTDWFNLSPLWDWLRGPLHLPSGTQDLTRLVPWIGMVWIGLFVGYKQGFAIPPINTRWISQPLLFLSKHSLLFYLLHQAPLFALAWLIGQLI
jgi:uncharacterized membrane protein